MSSSANLIALHVVEACNRTMDEIYKEREALEKIYKKSWWKKIFGNELDLHREVGSHRFYQEGTVLTLRALASAAYNCDNRFKMTADDFDAIADHYV